MTTPVGLPNYQQLRGIRAGLEVVRGTSATKTNKWYGRLELARHQPLADSEDFASTFFQDYTPVRGAVMVDGTYYQVMSYEDPMLFRYAVKGAVAAVDDGNTVHGYTYVFRHSATRDDRDTACFEYGYPMVYACEGVMFPEFTISSDIDDGGAVWKWNSRAIAISKDLKAGYDDVAATSGTTTTFVKTAWGLTVSALIGQWVHFKTGTAGNIGLFREITANDATSITFAALPSAVAAADTIDIYGGFTAGISDRVRENIKGPGTKLYLDTTTIGTTEITGRFISFSVTATLNAAYKRFMDNVSTMSTKQDLGPIRVTGQLRLEFDRKREWDKWKALAPEKIRIKQTGAVISTSPATTKSAVIDIYNAVYDDPTEDVRGNNITVTWPFRGYVDTTEGVPAQWSITNTQTALLA